MNTNLLLDHLLPLTSCDVVQRLKRREVSPLELVEVSRARIEQTDKHLNALPTLCLERARQRAKHTQAEKHVNRDTPLLLGGLPIAVKDLNDVAGVRTTYGSIAFANHVPSRSDYTVQKLESKGGVIVAKTNTPEFGAGGATFNSVFGPTANPWDISKNAGGSSGGSAAAVASGQVWAAQGSDLGGSLRVPASFCSVVGLRPTPGLVPRGPVSQPFSPLFVDGPIARNVADCALMLDGMAGYDNRDPLSRPGASESFLEATKPDPSPGLRIAFSCDLGVTPVAPSVEAVFSGFVEKLGAVAEVTEEAHPNLQDSPSAFQTLRAAWLAADMREILETHEKKLKPELVWNIQRGMELSADEIGRAHTEQGRTYREIISFFDDFDILVTPATAVPPFNRDCRYPEEIDGQKLETYFHWLAITSAISLTSCPAMSMPMGFTKDGLPVGVQVIVSPFAELELFRTAAALEKLLDLDYRLPVDPVSVETPDSVTTSQSMKKH